MSAWLLLLIGATTLEVRASDVTAEQRDLLLGEIRAAVQERTGDDVLVALDSKGAAVTTGECLEVLLLGGASQISLRMRRSGDDVFRELRLPPDSIFWSDRIRREVELLFPRIEPPAETTSVSASSAAANESGSHTVSWVLFGTGVAAAIASGVLAATGNAKTDELRTLDAVDESFDSLASQRRLQLSLSVGLLAASVGAITAGVVTAL